MSKLVTEDFHLTAFCSVKGLHFRTKFPGGRPVFEIEAEGRILDEIVREFESNAFLAKYNAALRKVRRRVSDTRKALKGGSPPQRRG